MNLSKKDKERMQYLFNKNQGQIEVLEFVNNLIRATIEENKKNKRKRQL